MRLRQALADSADSPRYIETVPRRGYRFIAHVDVPAQSAEPSVAGSAAPSGGRWLSLRMLAIAAVCAAAVWLLAMSMHWNPGRLISRSNHVTAVAVLPFENLSRDPNQAYFADGFTDELITTLAQIRALRVISRTSVIQYQGSKKNLRQIARELNVDAVLEGTVMHTGNQVRITAQLIQAGTDTHLWADTYERDERDVIQLTERGGALGGQRGPRPVEYAGEFAPGKRPRCGSPRAGGLPERSILRKQSNGTELYASHRLL